MAELVFVLAYDMDKKRWRSADEMTLRIGGTVHETEKIGEFRYLDYDNAGEVDADFECQEALSKFLQGENG